ncbi:UNVERIFIED_CONTAM: ATP-dependent RNA helicase-like protein DB10 [Sesamum calycinum]|uniref:ATP-dependent RNA helicase-like protein DB10 n=1 Tax=Sesamum calycinum TaxID=2727403 RepID=A0AAW2MKB4_9LAMI
MQMDASGEEGASVDWTTDDELEILVKIGTSSPPVLITNSIEVIAGNEEVDTVAYHLSVLKEIFPNGLNLLSLFSGIGGREVALHRLGIKLKNVVHLKSLSVQLETIINSIGHFDVIIGGSPCNNLAGGDRVNKVSRDGLERKESSLFFEYFGVLDFVGCYSEWTNGSFDMAATATGIRYAPEDPTLPKPWKGLVDDKTGYLYYWNPDTNITQYERPAAPSMQAPHHLTVFEFICSKVPPRTPHQQWSRSDYLQSEADVKTSFGYGSYAAKDAESGLSAESYRRRHEISVTYVEVLSPMDKRRRLEQILRSQEGSKIIIFCSTKKMCDQLAGSLTRQFGAAIHGDKSQGERDHVLNQFRTGRVVINYDFPTGVEDYVHRIGRTGRAGATGVAYTFFCDQDAKHASDLVKVLEGANQNVPVELRSMASRGGGMGRARRQWGSGPADVMEVVVDVMILPTAEEMGGGLVGECHQFQLRVSTMAMSVIGILGSGTCDGQDTIASGSFHYKSFHESMTAAAKNRAVAEAPIGIQGGVTNMGKLEVVAAAVAERFNGAAPPRRSFHESVMEGVRASPSKHARASSYGNPNSKDYKKYDNLQVAYREKSLSPRVNGKETVRGSNNSAADARRGSPPRQSRGYEEFANGSNSNFRDEEEDGMLPPEDNGLFRPSN